MTVSSESSAKRPEGVNPYSPPTDDTPDEKVTAEIPPQRGGGFLRHAAVYGVGAIAVQMVSVVLLPLYTRFMTSEEYGVLQLLYRVGDVLNICLMVTGINLAALNFWCKADSEEVRRRVPASIACLTFGVVLGGSALVLVSSGFFATQLKLDVLYPQAGWLLACGVIAMLLQATTVMPLAVMQARMESTGYLLASTSMALCQLVAVALALVVFKAGVWGVVVAMALTFGTFGIGLTARELARTSLLPDAKILWGVLKFALPFVPSGFFFFILSSGDQFFIMKYCGAAALGSYALAYRIAKSVMTFSSQPLMQVWNARMYDAVKQEDSARVFGQTYTRILAGYLFFGVGVILFLDEALIILGKFTGTEPLVAPLVFAHFFLAFAFLMDCVFYVKQRTDLKPWILSASTVVMLLAYWILIPRFQGAGGAWATLIGFMFHCGLSYLVAQRLFPVRIEWTRISLMLAASVAMTVAGFFLSGLTMAKAALFVGVLLSFWFSGVIRNDEKAALLGALNKIAMKCGWAH